MWSHEVKERLLEHIPNVMLFDSFGSSEAVGMGASLSTKGAASETAAFMLGERVAVFTEDGRRVEPGQRRARHGRGQRLPPRRLLQGPGQVRRDLQDVRGQAVVDPRRLGAGQPRRHASPARARLGVHQHGRREGLPRRGRGGAEAAPGRARRGVRGHPRRAIRRDDLRRGRAVGVGQRRRCGRA